MWPLLGGLISGGLNLLGGMMGQSNQAAINQQNIAAQEQINSQNVAAQEQINQANLNNQNFIAGENINLAEAFANNAIDWRVQDAKRAGISPLAALGAQVASPPTLQVGAPMSAATLQAPKADSSNAFGTGIAAMGQDISRAIAATRSPEEQAVAIEKTRQDLESGQLDNELKKAQLHSAVTRLASAQIGPGMPKPQKQAQDVITLQNADGTFTSGPSKESEGGAWASHLFKTQWDWRNNVRPAFGYNIPPGLKHDPGYSLYKNPLSGDFYQFPDWSTMWDTVKGLYGRARVPDISPSP